MRSQVREIAIILLVAGSVLFANLGKPRLWDRDEPRNAGCAVEMMQRGDWVVPMFNDELRTHKPVFLYWLTMAAYTTLGVSEFSARLPSAALALGTVFLTYGIGWRLLGQTTGFWSACVLVTFVMFGVVGRAATPDSTFVFFCTAALAVFIFSARQSFQEPAAASWRGPFPDSVFAAVAMYGLMGLAVLTKGPVGLVLPTAVIGMYCLIHRSPESQYQFLGPRFPSWLNTGVTPFMKGAKLFEPRFFLKTCWAMRPLTAVTTVALVAGPWYTWVGQRTDGAWLAGFLGEHNVGRAMNSMEGHGGSFFVYYPVALLLCCFPWSVFTIPTIMATKHGIAHDQQKNANIFLSCWIGVYVVLFSIAQTKLPSYVAPAYPAVALLIANYLRRTVESRDDRVIYWWKAGLVTAAGVGSVIAVGLTMATRRFLPGESSLGLVGLIPLAGGIAALLLVDRRRMETSIQAMTLTATTFSLVLFAVVAVRVSQHQQYAELLSSAPVDTQIACFGRLEPSWVFYARRPFKFFPDGEAGEAAAFVNSTPNHFLVTTDDRLPELRQQVKSDLRVINRSPYFLKDKQLLLITAHPSLAQSEPLQIK